MKKFALFLVLAMLAILPAAAEPTLTTIEGQVLEYMEGVSILIDVGEQGQVLAQIYDGTDMSQAEDLAVGDYVYIDYDGKMTRSIPARITATAVRCYRLEGDVLEFIPDENAMLVQTASNGEVYVRLPQDFPDVPAAGDPVRVYFNGVMTLSLPGQVCAVQVELGHVLQGSITQLNADSLLISCGDEIYQVNFEAEALPECLAVGDVIRVIYDGKMTRSIPAQVFGLEIIRISR